MLSLTLKNKLIQTRTKKVSLYGTFAPFCSYPRISLDLFCPNHFCLRFCQQAFLRSLGPGLFWSNDPQMATILYYQLLILKFYLKESRMLRHKTSRIFSIQYVYTVVTKNIHVDRIFHIVVMSDKQFYNV